MTARRTSTATRGKKTRASTTRKRARSKPATRKRKHREIRVRSWSEFVALATGPEFRNWAFRGHMHHGWPLSSTLARHLKDHGIDESVWAHQEERILRVFRRKALHFVEQLPEPRDAFRWLALMQHHGAPTRLLDLTRSPYVAAFFALERATENAAVWALHAAAIECETWNLMEERGLPRGFSPRQPGHIEDSLLPRQADLVFIGEPTEMNRRLIAQSGTFALQGALNKSIDDSLATYPPWREYAVKLVLSTDKIRHEAMRELYNMNLTPATLFPDLDGLARSLAYELEFHWAFDPRTGKLHDGFVWTTDDNGKRFPAYD